MKSHIEAPELYDYEDCRMPRTAAETGVRIPASVQKVADEARAKRARDNSLPEEPV